MPLLKRKSYELSQPPPDLRPDELVFLVRFTGEIFRKYEDYLEKITSYRQKIWTCKVTGKMGLTFEEALMSECQAVEKLQQFPKEFMGPVLNLVQFSVLRLDELVSTVMKFYKDHFVPGDELVYLEGNSLLPCKVMRVIEEHIGGNIFAACEVGWLDHDKNIIRMSVEPSDRLVRRKNPFTKAQLKSFIRESVRANMGRNAPWVVHEKLCHKYGISTEPPDNVKMFFAKQELSQKEVSGSSKRLAQSDDVNWESYVNTKQRRIVKDCFDADVRIEDKNVCNTADAVSMQPIKYPIDDCLVRPCPDDPIFTERPIPSSDFPLAMDCIGPLLMVWNFCILFCKAIHLFPFRLEEFEKALLCKTEDSVLLREAHNALLHSALSDPSLYLSFARKRKRKVIVSVQTWKDDLSDFLDLEGSEKLAEHSAIIRSGSYSHLDPSIKLEILCELVSHNLDSRVLRDQLDVIVEEKQAIAAQKRKEKTVEVLKFKEVYEKQLQTSEAMMEYSALVHPEDSDSDGNMNNGEPGFINGISGSGNWVPKPLLNQADEFQTSEDAMCQMLKAEDAMCQMLKAQAGAMRKVKRQEKKLIELQKRQEQLEREIEKRTIRINPLGLDRDYNRFWFFPREGRLFVEDRETSKWGYFSTKEELDVLYGSLNSKGIREKALQRQLEKHYSKISNAFQRRRKDMAQRFTIHDCSVRRSSRIKHVPQQEITVVYKNKYKIS